MAKFDTSAMVRLYLASAMQRTPLEKRWTVLESLYQHNEDKDDSNLPLMIWYAFEPLVPANAARALEIAKQTALPNTLKFTAMRIKAMNTAASKAIIQQLVAELSKGKGKETNHDILMAISDEPMKH